MRNRRPLMADHEGTREVWPAFTDVMSTMALILFVLVLLAYVRNLVSGKRLDALQRQITTSEGQLRATNDELRRTAAELHAGDAALKASEARLREQEQVITDSNHRLGELRSELESIAVLRLNVLNRLKQAIETELGPLTDAGADVVTIGDTGNLVINETLVFESNSYAIKPEAKPLLDGLARALGNLLADPAIRQNVEAIAIQGHTDERGSASFNWDLSAKRATAVLDRLFQANKVLADSYGRYFAASSYSKFRPLDDTRTPSAYQKNRRIEIAVIPKDTNIRSVIDGYMQQTAPGIDAGVSPP